MTVRAYDLFLAESRLAGLIRMELDRKRFEDMRWEEIWDAALRIRNLFLFHGDDGPIPWPVPCSLYPERPVYQCWYVFRSAFSNKRFLRLWILPDRQHR